MNKFFIFCIGFFSLLFVSCSEKPLEKPVVLSVDRWIGHAPIFYAHSMGWLEEANIKMLQTESIGESVVQFENGAADLITATAFEYKHLKEKHPDFTACIIHDRSSGGDLIMANRSLEELHKTNEPIELHLEPNTVNEDMWHYFIRFEHFDKNRFRIAPRSLEEMSRLKTSASEPPVMAITFNPYNLPMMKNGFQEIVSTKDERYLIVDGVHGKRSYILQHKEKIALLNKVMADAEAAYKKDPKAFYEKVKAYLNNPTYEEFEMMVGNIEWIFPYPTPIVLDQLKSIGYETKDLIR